MLTLVFYSSRRCLADATSVLCSAVYKHSFGGRTDTVQYTQTWGFVKGMPLLKCVVGNSAGHFWLRIFTSELYSGRFLNAFVDAQNVVHLVECLLSMHETPAQHEPGMMVHAWNSITQDVEIGGSQIQGQSQLLNVFRPFLPTWDPELKNKKNHSKVWQWYVATDKQMCRSRVQLLAFSIDCFQDL